MKTVIFLLALLPSLASAENWHKIPVGNEAIYMDKDSVARTGDLVRFNYKLSVCVTSFTAEVDCTSKRILHSDELLYCMNVRLPPSAWQDMSALACKRWYEVWK